MTLSRAERLLFVSTAFVCFGVLEGGLRMIEKFRGPRFSGLATALGESFFFHGMKDDTRRQWLAASSDPLVGWWNVRRPASVTAPKRKARVVLVGGTFTHGAALGETETIGAQLERLLNGWYEVVNVGVPGYSLDQMAVLATEYVPKLSPDWVVVGFTGDELRRACQPFTYGQLPKPYFRLDGEKVKLEGVPVPSPEALMKKHEEPEQRVLDAIAVYGSKLRAVNLVYEPYRLFKEARCYEFLTPRVLQYVVEKLQGKTRVRFLHLDQPIPDSFAKRVAELGLPFSSLPSRVAPTARQLKLSVDKADTRHPTPALAGVYAYLYRDRLR